MIKTDNRFLSGSGCFLLIFVLLACILIPRPSWAVFGDTREKPEPVFTHEDNKITAKYIPQAKSTSVLVDFEVTGGTLVKIKGMDFELAKAPEIDSKDFKSALFTIEIGEISPGAEVRVSIRSNFFSSSTEYWIFNKRLKTQWMNSMAENVSLPDLFQEMIISVKDGGPFDSDGAADGKIFLVGGPKDSFWGYALGTLFIRFFGIFLVLSILMVGMMLSGKVFHFMDRKKAEPASEPVKQVSKPEEKGKQEISPETAAAIAMTLHIHFSALRPSVSFDLSAPKLTSWAQQGREKIMGERFLIYNR